MEWHNARNSKESRKSLKDGIAKRPEMIFINITMVHTFILYMYLKHYVQTVVLRGYEQHDLWCSP